MALKYKIDEETYNKLSKDFKSEYKKVGDEYVLDVEGGEDTGALKRAKDHEKASRVKAEAEANKLKEQVEEIQAELEAMREKSKEGGKKGDQKDVEALEKSWQAKLAKKEKELGDKVTSLSTLLQKQLVDSVAMTMASTLAGTNAELLLPHIQRRLAAEISDGAAITKVLGADGTPSALTVEELQKEFLSNEKFSSIVIGSKASGGSAGGRKGSGGGAPKKLSEMSATEEAKFANENPTEYRQMIEKESAAV
jgi:hypothetical protein